MAKLYFRYGAMGASKSANALMVEYNYRERNQNALLLKPAIDNRDSITFVASRLGIKGKATVVSETENLFELIKKKNSEDKINCIIADEAQFFSKNNVLDLCRIVDELNIPVIAYGLRTDFKGELFEGSMWLLAWADTIEEIKTVCFCSKKATMNARLIDGVVTKTGEQIQLGGNESYTALCRRHWREGKTSF